MMRRPSLPFIAIFIFLSSITLILADEIITAIKLLNPPLVILVKFSLEFRKESGKG